MNFTKTNIFIVLSLLTQSVMGQMQMGISHDNVNVTEGIRINPAFAVDPIPWLDIHVGGLYIFGGSDALYAGAGEFNPFKRQLPSNLSQNLDKQKVNGQVELEILGPALNVSLGKFSLGLSSALKNYAVGRNIPKEFAQGLVYGLQLPEYYGDTLTGTNYRTKEMSYIELGLNGGMIIHQKGRMVVSAGVNLKYLLGVGGLYFLADEFNYSMQDSTNAYVDNYRGQYGGSDFGFHPGVGWGADVGIKIEKKAAPSTYYKPHSKQSGCDYIDYIYRLGFSVLDIGNIKYKGSYYRDIGYSNGDWNDYAGFERSSVEDIIRNLDGVFATPEGIKSTTSKYTAKLPLALSLQFDYNFGRGLYVNSTLVYGASFQKHFGGERLSLLAITPRFEGRRFGISAPLSINSLWRPGLGLAFRVWFLTIGTDNIGSYLFQTDIYRMDIYAHIKIPLFTNPGCKQRGPGEKFWNFSDCSAPGASSPRKRKSKRN